MYVNYGEYERYLEIYFPNEIYLFSKEELLISYYQLVTFCFFIYFVFLFAIVKLSNTIKTSQQKLYNKLFTIKSVEVVYSFLVFTILYWLFFLYFQIKYKLGLVSGDELGKVNLPYRLAGIIMININLVVPLFFLINLNLSALINKKKLEKLIILLFCIYGITTGLISTSKASLYVVIISLIIFWYLNEKFNKTKIITLLFLMPIISLYNTLLSTIRVIRTIDQDINIFSLLTKTVSSFFGEADLDILNGATEGALLNTTKYYSLIMRVNGADSLLNIINYNAPVSFERVINLLFIQESSVNYLYATEVLGLVETQGLAFSPSLLGYFTFLLGNQFLICFVFLFYIVFWHILFVFIKRIKLFTSNVVLPMFIVLLAHYTSEGTLESMIQSIFQLLILVFILEYLVKFFFIKLNKSI